jgi:hypothetical protein
MWRTRAVLSLLHEEIAGLPGDTAETAETRAEALGRARRRALIVVLLDWAAIVALTLLGERVAPTLTLGPTEDTVFTLALLAVAAHSGFRLAQLQTLRAVARAQQHLAARDPDA